MAVDPVHEGLAHREREPARQEGAEDWRIGVSHELGRVSLQAAWSDGSPGYDFYNQRHHGRSALVLGATLAL